MGGATLHRPFVLAISVLALGCGSTPRAAENINARISSSHVDEVARPAEAVSIPSASAADSAESTTPPTTPSQELEKGHVELGTIYALGDAHETPSDWNDESTGRVVSDAPSDPTHALPRVVIDVPKSTGKLSKGVIESHARAEFWGHVIECYRPGAVKDQSLRGETTLRVTIGKAQIRSAKVVKPMPDKEVSACLAKRLVGTKMPEARGSSTATMTIHVAPGDEPMSPTDDMITRGPGKLDAQRLREVFLAALPRFVDCYEATRVHTPDLRGWLSIRIQVAPDGKLLEAFEAGSHFPDDHLARCVLHEVRKLATDPPLGGTVRAFVPLRFSPP